MQEADIQIINKLGLHARAAAKFVSTAKQFQSRVQASLIEDECNSDVVDGKNIMSLMLLAATQGTWLRIRTEGADECEALTAIQALIEDRFEEDE